MRNEYPEESSKNKDREIKIISIESDSENQEIRHMAENESETPLSHNFFDSITDNSEENPDEDIEDSFDFMHGKIF